MVFARLVCCGLGFESHLVDLHLDDRILSLHGVLGDLGLFHLHCVRVVLGVYVHNLFNVRCLILSFNFKSSAGLYVFETCCVPFETLVICFCEALDLRNLDHTGLIDLCQIDRRLDQPSLLSPSS